MALFVDCSQPLLKGKFRAFITSFGALHTLLTLGYREVFNHSLHTLLLGVVQLVRSQKKSVHRPLPPPVLIS
jgi:hypothetical protein